MRLDKFLKVSSACTVTKLDYYMVVINKKWYSYRGSCMGTYQSGEGDVEDLTIKYNSERDEFSFVYDGNRFVKNKNLLTMVPKETFISSKQDVALDGYKLLAQETMFENHYYVFDRYISGVGGTMVFGKDDASSPYTLTIMAHKEREESAKYKYESHNYPFPVAAAHRKYLFPAKSLKLFSLPHHRQPWKSAVPFFPIQKG